MEISIVEVKKLTTSQKQQIADLCYEAFDENPWDQYAFMHKATHLIGTLNNQIVTHALWTDRNFSLNHNSCIKTAYVEYVVTSEKVRGQGLASDLLRYLIHALKERDYKLAALQPENEAFYSRLGWLTWLGGLYIKKNQLTFPTNDAQIMMYPLTEQWVNIIRTCSDSDAIYSAWREGELW